MAGPKKRKKTRQKLKKQRRLQHEKNRTEKSKFFDAMLNGGGMEAWDEHILKCTTCGTQREAHSFEQLSPQEQDFFTQSENVKNVEYYPYCPTCKVHSAMHKPVFSDENPISEAIMNDDFDEAKFLIAKSNIQEDYADLLDALGSAAVCGNVEIAKILLEKGMDVNGIDPKDGYTPLMMVCENGHLEMLKLLLEYGADINIKRTDGNDALWIAAKELDLELVEELLKHGADPKNSKDPISVNQVLVHLAGQSDVQKLMAALKKYGKYYY